MLYYLAIRGKKGFNLISLRVDNEGIIQGVIKVLQERGITAQLVHTKAQKPPRGYMEEKKRNTIWCPYCQAWRGINTNEVGYTACGVCGVSIKDYYTRIYNGIPWGGGIKDASYN